MKTNIILTFLLVSINCFSQNFEWAHRFHDPQMKFDQGESVAVDLSGNVYVTGYVNKDPEEADIYIVKYDSDGEKIWEHIIGTNDADCQGHDIVIDTENNSYVTGSFTDQIIFGNDTLFAEDNYADPFIVKLSANGVLVWAKALHGLDYDIGQSIAIDEASNIYVSGQYESNIKLDAFEVNCIGGRDIFLAKLDAQGNSFWLKSFGSTHIDKGNSLKYFENKLYMAGQIGGTAYFDTVTLNNPSWGDAFLSVHDKDGHVIFAKNAIGDNSSDAHDIAVLSNGDIIIVGYFYGPTNFGSDILPYENGDNFGAKYDSLGNSIQAKVLGGDNSYAIETNNSDEVFITGYFYEYTTFDTIPLTSWGFNDIYVVKFDNAMNALWTQHAGGHSDDYVFDLVHDEENNIYITGTYAGYMGYAAFGSHTLITNNTGNFYITKIRDDFTQDIKQFNKKPVCSMIYPNPVSDYFHCKSEKNFKTIKVYDITGQIAITENNDGKDKSVNVNHLKKGIYLIELISLDDNTTFSKMIKE